MKLRPIAVAFATAFSVAAFANGTGHQSQSDSGMQQPQAISSQGSGGPQQSQSDEKVKNAQQALSENGQNPGPADGILGPKTQAALKDFQKQKGIDQTGQLDQQTLAALQLDESGQPASSSTGSSASPASSQDQSSSQGSSEDKSSSQDQSTSQDQSSSGSSSSSSEQPSSSTTETK